MHAPAGPTFSHSTIPQQQKIDSACSFISLSGTEHSFSSFSNTTYVSRSVLSPFTIPTQWSVLYNLQTAFFPLYILPDAYRMHEELPMANSRCERILDLRLFQRSYVMGLGTSARKEKASHGECLVDSLLTTERESLINDLQMIECNK